MEPHSCIENISVSDCQSIVVIAKDESYGDENL